MTTRDDKEYNKFTGESGEVSLKAVNGLDPSTAILTGTIDELEEKKFTLDGKIRIITTF